MAAEYTTIIIDDNRLAVEALEKTIPWEKLGLKLVGSAFNGRQGMELIEKFRPDIILSDIQMPEMDGLTMMERMADTLNDSRVIFITAYEKIEYASRAIKLAAFDFILKPVDNDELCKSLQRAKESLRKDRDAEKDSDKLKSVLQRTRFLVALTQHIDDSAESFLGFTDIIPDSYFIIVAESKGELSGPSLQRLEFIEFPENVDVVTGVVNGDIVIFCGMSAESVPWQTVSRTIAGELSKNIMNLTMAVSNPHTEPGDFRLAYEEALQTLLYHHIYERQTDLDYFCTPQMNTVKHTRLTDIEQLCSKLAQKVDSITAEQVWEIVIEKSGGRLRLIKIMLMFFCTKVMQDKVNSSKWADSVDMTVYDLTKLETEEDARAWLCRFFEEVHTINVPATTSLVRSVLEYVKAHVTDGLVLEDVAAKFYVSPNYLSALIRKEMGQTYRQYVIDAKMAVAKQLLNDTRMRVEDVAYAVGYENYISFYNIFKKIEHISPSEYRLSKRSE